MTPEKAFLARVCVEHCIATNDQAKLEVSLPVVTLLAYRIQSVYNKYQEDLDAVSQERALRALDANERDVDERLDDLLLDAEFVIAEMLKLAVNLDYADEIGRRKMFQLVRDMIGQEGLPEGLVARCLDVLRVLSPSERDLIRVVVEVVHELRDEGEAQDEEREGEKEGEDDANPSAVSAPKAPKVLTPEEQARTDALDLRCLSLCIGMLERVNGVRLSPHPRNDRSDDVFRPLKRTRRWKAYWVN
jgi:condensin complex subunit 3